jgi:hypothetical protein
MFSRLAVLMFSHLADKLSYRSAGKLYSRLVFCRPAVKPSSRPAVLRNYVQRLSCPDDQPSSRPAVPLSSNPAV